MFNMKLLLVLGCLVATVIADKYTTKYDNVNLKQIIESDRLLLSYFECVMGRGKCTPDGKELKDNLQDAIETGCEKCTETQEEGATTVIDHLIKNKPELWKELCAKFDPEGKWRTKYEDRAKAKGITIPK